MFGSLTVLKPLTTEETLQSFEDDKRRFPERHTEDFKKQADIDNKAVNNEVKDYGNTNGNADIEDSFNITKIGKGRSRVKAFYDKYYGSYKNYTFGETASELAQVLPVLGISRNQWEQHYENIATILIIKDIHGNNYMKVRAAALKMVNPLDRIFLDVPGVKGKKKSASKPFSFNRGDFKNACKIMRLDPAKIFKDDPNAKPLSLALQALGSRQLEKDNFIPRIMVLKNCDAKTAKDYVHSFGGKFWNTKKEITPEIFKTMTSKQHDQYKQVHGHAQYNKIFYDAYGFMPTNAVVAQLEIIKPKVAKEIKVKIKKPKFDKPAKVEIKGKPSLNPELVKQLHDQLGKINKMFDILEENKTLIYSQLQHFDASWAPGLSWYEGSIQAGLHTEKVGEKSIFYTEKQ